VRFSFGYAIDARVRQAILALPEAAWWPAINGDGERRDGAWVADLTGHVSLDAWPPGSRLIVRRERPHPGAQLSFTDVDGHRFQCFITDQPDPELAVFQGWLEAALCAHDLTVWTQLLLFEGEHRVCEPKRLRYRLLHVAGRLTRHARRLTLHLPADWPWTGAIARAFKRLPRCPPERRRPLDHGPTARGQRPPPPAVRHDRSNAPSARNPRRDRPPRRPTAPSHPTEPHRHPR
jgi:Transposase DDE domain group 1